MREPAGEYRPRSSAACHRQRPVMGTISATPLIEHAAQTRSGSKGSRKVLVLSFHPFQKCCPFVNWEPRGRTELVGPRPSGYWTTSPVFPLLNAFERLVFPTA
eukprot:scaffold24873_cov37-Phaeocystis_antarctica.AAC.2